MGDKIRARNFVAHNGFPVAPSAVEEDDPATFLDRARAVGVPLVVKPSAGGGGKGMRIVRDLAELDDARGAKGSVISATGDCMPSGLWKGQDISRFRFWAIPSEMSCTCSSGNVRCRGVSRRSLRKPRRRHFRLMFAKRFARQPRASRAQPATGTPGRRNSFTGVESFTSLR